MDFADGRAQLVATEAEAGGLLVGQKLYTLRTAYARPVRCTIGGHLSRRQADSAEGRTVIEENDMVFFLAARRDIPAVMKELRPMDNPVRRVILAGGGNIGKNLARSWSATIT